MRRVGDTPTVAEVLEIEQRRQRLRKRIEKFHGRAKAMWPVIGDEEPTEYWHDRVPDFTGTGSDDEDDSPPATESSLTVERLTIYLPSTIGMQVCVAMGYIKAAQMEKRLRVGQQNDALQNIRVAVSRKACIFRDGIRASKSKKKKTRSWDHLHAVDLSVRHNTRVYDCARASMMRLNPSNDELERYKPLTKEDLKVDTARVEPGLRGHRGSHLAWFWTMDIASDVEQQEGMRECRPHAQLVNFALIKYGIVYRVHWLKAKSRRDRCKEEVDILEHEMDSVWLSYLSKAIIWRGRASLASQMVPSAAAQGMEAYALAKEKMWLTMADDARADFQSVGLVLPSL